MWTIVSGLMFWGGGTFFSWSRVIINFFKKKIDSQGNRTTFETSNYSVMLSNENQTGINAWLDPKWITWCHLLAIFSTLQFLRFVFQCMMETNILKYALIGPVIIMVFQISSFLMGNSFYYFLLQLGARHWGGERVVRVRRQIREEEPDRLLSTSASTTTPIMSGSGGGLRRNLSRGELRTIIGLTLFASLSDMVFLSNSPQNHPLTSSSSILNASNSILGTSNLTLSNSGWTMNDQNPNKTKSLDHTKPLNTLQEDFYDKTKSDDEKKFVGINDKNDGKEMNNPRKVNRDINMVKNNQNRLNKDSNTNLSSNNDYEILDSLPAFCVHMIVLVSCIFLTYLQLLQVRFFRKKLQEGKYIVLGFDWVPNEQGKQINSQRSKIRKYKRIEVYHWFNLFLLLIPAASIQVLSVLFLIRTDTRGRRVFSDKWGFTATFYTNQLCTTHAFVFWTICSLSGLL